MSLYSREQGYITLADEDSLTDGTLEVTKGLSEWNVENTWCEGKPAII